MAGLTSLAAATTVGNPTLNISIFVIFVLVTLTVVIKVAGGKKTAEQYYTAGGAFSGRQNGIAIAGDYLSAASFLGIAGAIALQGMDGFLYSIGFLVAWLVALLLVAELMRNTGRFTMADVLAYRLKQRPIRIAVSVSVLCVSLFYLLAQMAGAGGLVSLLLGVSGEMAQNLVIAVVGVVMVTYVLIGGMKGTTWVQIIKAVLLITAAFVMTVWVLGKYGFSLSGLFDGAIETAKGSANAKTVAGADKLTHYGVKYGVTTTSKIDFISLALALVLGTAGLPHVLQRFYTVPTSKQARKSVEWAIWLIGGFYLLTLVIGFGAGALVGPDKISAAPGKANSAAPLLAYELGGSWMLGIVAGIAFATILAVVAGLTITASATFAHDLYKEVFKRGQSTQDQEVKVARYSAIAIGLVAIFGGMLAKSQNIAFLVALAFAVAASANLPTILYSLFWKGFNTKGALWSIYGGLISSIGLIIFSPVVSGKPAVATKLADGTSAMLSPSMFTNPDIDFHWFPLDNPGLISIPLAFFLGWLGSKLSKEHNAQKYAEMEVRSLTGHGVGPAVDH
ncbi:MULTISPECIES: cation acetate symporter [Phycicoccus]|jgi:cation/acetate symporter|uniref:Acetate transporter n=1 Tax=Phycicoccus elongatus Lp2 TaxID=1193181 RepID=N0E3Y1_9MICO|nr:cation acetate symporter [Phycicoccus elongatus]MBK8729306.1 cation acetate symporter [Tetrasphaera sp.]CCH70470.1 Acetate transporter [Phycicoccus elongatus Lp2]HRC17963.1 cation acetate symporter [Phycicoccus elongatus]